MSYYLKLLGSTSGSRTIFKSIRSFSLIQYRGTNGKRYPTELIKRFKSSQLSSKAADIPKVKLQVSDLKRLLSLAKQEKWKITGLALKTFQKKSTNNLLQF